MGSLSSKINTAIAQRLTSYIRKYDQNWFVRFVNEAHREDAYSGLSDPLKQHAWVNIAVFFLANNISRAPFKLMRGETEITTGPVAKLFGAPNALTSRYQLWQATQAWRKATGEAFWVFDMLLQGPKVAIPQTIHVVSPKMMTHKTDESGEITMWMYENGQTKIPFLPSEIIHFRDWNPWNIYRGVNPLIAQDYELAQDIAANQNNLSTLLNGSVPGGVLTNKQNGSYINEDQAKEIKERWEAKHRGPNKNASIAVLGNGLEYQAIQQTIKDMEYFDLKKWNRQTILSRYGVPNALVNVTDEKSQLSGNDTQAQMQNVWNHTLIPDCKFYEGKLQTDFFDRFGLDMKGVFDLEDIPELAEDEKELSEKAKGEIAAGMITINEWRKENGLEPVEWGYTWWVPLGQTPADIAMKPPEPVPAALANPAEPKEPPKMVSIETLMTKKPKQVNNEIWRTFEWKAMVGYWEKLEGQYTKALRDWFFAQRSYLLEKLSGKHAADMLVKDIPPTSVEAWRDFAYWLEQEAELQHISKPIFTAAAIATGKRLIRQFIDLDIVFDADNWSIMNTGAVAKIETRLTKIGGIVKTVRDHVGSVIEQSLKEGWTVAQTAEALREKYGYANNRAKTIARTELGGVISDAKIEGFVDVGITEIMWSTARDSKVRETHMKAEGEVVKIGQNFSNGLMWPREPGADASQSVNCRCDIIPLKPEGDE